MSEQRIRLGMLTPSSNTVLEPVTCCMLSRLDGVTAHFSRFPVREIALDANSVGQFDPAPMLSAASLLADAKVDVIAWNGTSASWLGLDTDRRLCQLIEAETGVVATTCVLSLVDAFRATHVRRFGLVTPYTADVQKRIIDNFAAEGFDCVADRHLDIRDNYAFAEVRPDTLAEMIRDVARSAPDAITVLCTNLAAAPLVEALEAETGVPIHDSVAVTIWGALRRAGGDWLSVPGWGRLLAQAA